MKKGLLTANAEAGTRDAFQRTGVIKKNIIIIVKPDNLMLDGQGYLKVIDCGILNEWKPVNNQIQLLVSQQHMNGHCVTLNEI